ncbi:Long chain acyl-CoA synthetase 7 peroxisomal [Phytophthora pseudosyringae]|uniref:Long chain acyl-CoA synthetase 7 peroxisomal n=1 Tax=Phytophthora pseudosyringae TaxID=221518 RepID=A0A8T1VDN5_9STRA|nr:Long chain acyl-CoA synthetase 7 peroxisomal [Phytophthora pseudosyringae]
MTATSAECSEPNPIHSCVLPGTATAMRGPVHASTLRSGFDPSFTLYSNLLRRREIDPEGSHKLFGTRKVDPETGVVGPYEWVTLSEFLVAVDNCAAGMSCELGLQRGALVGIFSKNRYEWSVVEHSTSRMTYTLVPLYDTLGPTAVLYIINHTEMKVAFCAKEQIKTLLACIKDCPSVGVIVQFEDKIDGEDVSLARANKVSLMTLDQLMEIGRANPVGADPPLPDDLCTICYTSGTMGDPKGVMLTHSNMIASILCFIEITPLYESDVHLSFLPLAHCFERNVQAHIIAKGGCIGYYQGDVTKLLEDMAELRPTVFPSVPRLLNRIHDKITQGVAAAGRLKKLLFDQAYAAKKEYLAEGYYTHAFWDRLVFDKLKMVLGGRVRYILSGSAPLSKEVKEFMAIVFCCPVLEGYGLTETAAVVSCAMADMPMTRHVGIPVSGAQVCLEDVPEKHYSARDTPCPRGEILTKSGHVFKGYYKQLDLTNEVLDADCWFHTGDIGQWNPDGTLTVIDRKKNIFKLSQGEYVSPERVEGVYGQSPFVAQVFVHGDSFKNYVVGIVVPDPEFVAAWAEKQGLKGEEASLENLCAPGNKTLLSVVQEDMRQLALAAKLLPFERAHKLRLHVEQFTPENGLATPTFKPKRFELIKHFSDVIDEMYEEQSKL